MDPFWAMTLPFWVQFAIRAPDLARLPEKELTIVQRTLRASSPANNGHLDERLHKVLYRVPPLRGLKYVSLHVHFIHVHTPINMSDDTILGKEAHT